MYKMFGNKTKRESSEILMKEHENILKVVEALDRECNLIKKGGGVDEEFFKKVIDFIKDYADKFHHAKEEEILFKEFNKCAGEDSECVHCNPVEQMLSEHDKGRNFVKGMIDAMKNRNKTELIENARGYIYLIQEHIYKENNILYPMADGTLSEKTEKEMMLKFKKITKQNKSKEEKHLSFVESLILR